MWMHRISHRPRTACCSIHQHRCCESSDRSPQPRQVNMQIRQMRHTSHVALDPIESKCWPSQAWKCPLTVDPRRPQGSCFSAEATCHAGSFMHMCLWVNSRKMQNDTGNSVLGICNRVTLIRLVLKNTKNYSRTSMCVGLGKHHCQLTWLSVTVCRHFRRFISISCKMQGDPPGAVEPYTDKWMGTMLAN